MLEFSSTTKEMRSSEIRRLMKLAADPSIISFAGGMPANELLPIEIVDEIYNKLSISSKLSALQYGPTSGYPPLIEALKHYLKNKGLPVENNGLIITTGAQQAINLLAKIFIDPGDLVVTEEPTFIGAVAAFKSFNANLASVNMDNNGIILKQLQKIIDIRASQIKILYLCPCFHNPAGIVYSIERKKELLSMLKGHNFCIVEDDPYNELYFDDADKSLTTSLKALDNDTLPICYVGSFAKIFGPGLRLGWLLAPPPIIEKCELAKQSIDACSSTFSQVIAYEYLSSGKLEPYLERVRPIYARRAKITLDALSNFMPKEVSWTVPKGGFYIWVTLPSKIDSSAVLELSLKKGAAFVIGKAFDPYGMKNNSFRLAFSFTPEDKIEEGIAIIADAIRMFL
ncbi:MAG: PLP-dependent aminotransferase family protein [Chitinispirillaceae bacterium]|nr:PLP-dependent aminotransferase family protein [Chitinispirillaceae bacterium]